jgi:pimeloyl-ACP methyl ester carboxylesterase
MIRSHVRAAVAFLFLTLMATPAAAANLTLKPYEFKPGVGPAVPAEWGEITVRENRKDPKSRLIKLAFVRFKATTAHPGAPIVYLAGGPGSSGIGTARGPRFPAFMKMRESADVIAFDQRGTGDSTQIPPCPAAKLDTTKPLTRDYLSAHFVEGIRHCWDVWKGQGIAIDSYTTVESAADLDELRRDLGAKKLNLWGISYGSHLGLAYLKLYPNKVDRAILASVEGLDQTVKLPSHEDAVLGRIAAAVAADPEADTPDLLGLMRRVHAKLETGTVRFSLSASPTAASFTTDAFILRAMAGGMIKNPGSVGQMLQLYKGIDAGAYVAVAPAIYSAIIGETSSLSGMGDAMDTASGISAKRLARVEAEAKTAILGDALNYPMPQAVGAIPGLDLGEKFRGPFKSNRPVMVISGELDGRTPLEEQAEATTGLTNKTRIMVHGVGHDIYEAEPRLWPLMQAFFAGETVGSREIERPPVDFVRAKR